MRARLVCRCGKRLGMWPVETPGRLLAFDAALWERLGGVPHGYCACGGSWVTRLTLVGGKPRCRGCGREWPLHRGLLVRPDGGWRTRCPRCGRDIILDPDVLDRRLLAEAVRRKRRDPTLAVE